MQNRYVGDLGDFAKYALLRGFVGPEAFKLGIVWCLFHDETHNGDGRHTRYLTRNDYRELDRDLHDALAKIVQSGKRSVHKIPRAGLFPADTIFFEQPIATGTSRHLVSRHDRELFRINWLSQALAATSECEIVFFDPDNGLEIPSVSKYQPKAGKYIFLNELRDFWKRGQSLIVYHHLNRTATVRDQTDILRRRLSVNFSDAAVVNSLLFRGGSCRHFWIIGQRSHKVKLHRRIEAIMNSGWRMHFEIC